MKSTTAQQNMASRGAKASALSVCERPCANGNMRLYGYRADAAFAASVFAFFTRYILREVKHSSLLGRRFYRVRLDRYEALCQRCPC